jgi:hypothetical protein
VTGPYDVFVIGVSYRVHGRVRGRVRSCDGLKMVSGHQCDEHGPEGVALAYPAGGCSSNGAWLVVGEEACSKSSQYMRFPKWNEGGVPGCYSGEEIGLINGIEGVGAVAE